MSTRPAIIHPSCVDHQKKNDEDDNVLYVHACMATHADCSRKRTMRTPCWSSTGCLFPALPPPRPCGILCMVSMYPSCVFTCKGRNAASFNHSCHARINHPSIHPHLSALGYLIFLALVTLRAHHGGAHAVIRRLEALQQLPSSVSSGQLAMEAHGEDEGDDEKPATESHVGGKPRMRSPTSPRIGLVIVRRVRRKSVKDETSFMAFL